MTIREAQSRLLFQLYHLYSNTEAANIADVLMEKLTGWKKIDRVVHKDVKLSMVLEKELERFISEIAINRPVQYIINECWFYGLKFYVDERVLIPRPETEELVELVLKSSGSKASSVIVDIGTGSGCIPVAIKKNWPAAEVYSCDVSGDAITVAEMNAASNDTDIKFVRTDILLEKNWQQLPACDIIVSNPPYIPRHQKTSMASHVVDFEPEIALFVDYKDSLIFYRGIARLGKLKLHEGGKVYVELHEDLAVLTKELFSIEGYTEVEIRRDMQGKERMLFCTRP